ncbi:MAG TPA: cyanase [Halothiobacillus sp.]|jgi:cyanate lyase|nr:cyanase [Halothiobacillus sp.]
MMTKEALTALILDKKEALALSWEAIASGMGLSPVFAISACLGMNSLKEEPAKKLVTVLELPPEALPALMACPTKVWDKAIPTDPLIYRLYEVVGVYGPTIKTLIHEKFGDGIMSAIDFSMHIDKEPNPAGDRVVITMNGKFLPYKSW